MAGYRQRTIRLTFPDLSGPDDLVWVEIRNSKQLTAAFFDAQASDDVADPYEETAPEATETPDQAVERLQRNHDRVVKVATARRESAGQRTYRMYSDLIVNWHVYPADGPLEEQERVLPLPATPAALRRLPQDIIVRMSKALAGDDVDTVDPVKAEDPDPSVPR